MEPIYLEDAKKIFLEPPQDAYYEGVGDNEFTIFLRMLGYIIPHGLTTEELLACLNILINDIRNKNCSFKNSKELQKCFNSYLQYDHLDMWLTYIPSFIEAVTPTDFANEFNELFRESFFHLERNVDDENNYGCIEVGSDIVDISNKDKAEVLAALYNHSKPIGMGIVHYDPTPMTVDIARKIINKMGYSFGYLKGRTMKVNLQDNIVSVRRYNLDNNRPGLAQMAISKCRNIEPGVNPTTLKKELKKPQKK